MKLSATVAIDLRRPGWKKLSPSPRHLVHKHAKRIFRQGSQAVTARDTESSQTESSAESGSVPAQLQPGQEQLYSSYVPGLEAGMHRIDVQQDVTAGSETKSFKTSHQFNVIAPRFSLPDKAIDSIYPPQGHADLLQVLPHMVFHDPTLPWERIASWKDEHNRPPDFASNRVPWLAVLLFTREELRLDPAVLSSMFADTSLGTTATQSPTLTVTLPVAEVVKVKDTASSVVWDENSDGTNSKADLILLRSALFNGLFTEWQSDGTGSKTQTNCYVQPYRYLAHLRHVHLDGTAAAAQTDDDDHAYSVVVSHRTGPLDITQPTPVVAHLVNIEGVEAMPWPVAEKSFVAMTSLYSWEYTCLPPGSFNVADAFRDLGDTLGRLRPGLTPTDKEQLQKAGGVGTRVAQRIDDGFSLARYRLQTGEVSSAFFRGPLTPNTVSFPDTEKPAWPATSTTGTKLQILDDQLNIVDITYSAAWALGRTLALADQAFSAALSRVRKQIFDEASNLAQLDAIKTWAADLGIPAPHRTREEVVSTIADTVRRVGELPSSRHLPQHPRGMVNRWHRPERPALNLSYKNSEVDPIIDKYLAAAARKVASSVGDGDAPYNEHNVPYSADWAVVLRWVMDRYFLANMPAHYLISDPSHLPSESLRFFYVDPAWVSAMVDGGLSLANHLDSDDDRVRDAIKGAINTYLTTPMPRLGYVPPVPTYGFFVRSALVTKFPDLIVDLKPRSEKPAGDSDRPPVILRHEVIGQDTLLGLLREYPAAPDFTSLLLRQPPHQQYFSAAEDLGTTGIIMQYQRVYTDDKADDPNKDRGIPYNLTRDGVAVGRGVNFIWGTDDKPTTNDLRLVNVENMAQDVHTQLINLFTSLGHPKWYKEVYPTSALMGIQLNEPSWQLEVTLPGVDKLSKAAALLDGAMRTLPINPRRQPSESCRKRASSSTPIAPHPPPVTGPSQPPVITYKLYPITAAALGQSQVPVLPTPQDLVFSLVLEKGTGQSFDLEYIQLSVPLQGPRPLMDNYAGAGAVMLSNLRFNVIAQFAVDGSALLLTLRPRSTKGYLAAVKIEEMSFLLSGVVVHGYGKGILPVSVDVGVVEKYRDREAWGGHGYVRLVSSP
ncbi:hypothetical protein N656DRAFT_763547 [Canariomyces notabilis]|uniref:Uncharacterized protein n=1 Tax=Canariomyces notabilis TaxID=2074819 RepID=A0AAN6QD36_9PEZI|nr:hypothetical protein N656DRAFT_763547 [Canariomyces arenarius]